MGKTLLWIECGGCSGESMAILGLDGPLARGDYNLAQFLEDEHVRLLWHPSLSLESPRQLLSIADSIVSGKEELTLFCVEGSIINGPNGTGMYDSIHGKPKRDVIAALCDKAEYVLAMGTCAAFGGIPAAPPNPTESSGLQFSLDKPGGLLGPEWRSRAGFPVFNLSGCPVDAVTMLRTMSSILNGAPPALDTLNRPALLDPQPLLRFSLTPESARHPLDVPPFNNHPKTMKDILDSQLRQQLDAKIKSYDEAVNNNDATAVAAQFTEDAVFVTDKGPVYGRQAIEKWYADSFQEWHRENHIGKADEYSPHIIGTAGNELWSTGEWSETLQGKGGEVIHLKGYWSAIIVREGDAWKDRMLTWNITPPPAS